ncbi:MAG: hypothetical protein ACLURP_15850 [Ruminococcus sp.]
MYHTCPGITIKNSGIAFVKCKNVEWRWRGGEVIAYSKFNNMEKKHGSSPSKIIDVVYALVRERKIPVTDQI